MDKSRRQQFMQEIASLAHGDKWATSDNPVKRRIGRLEIAWRDGLQGVMSDIQTLFSNNAIVADAYDIIDVNLAAVKSLCVDKGVFTEDEFLARRAQLFGILDRERARRQVELDEKLKAARELEEGRVIEHEPELVRITKAAAATVDSDHVPPQATIFGAS